MNTETRTGPSTIMDNFYGVFPAIAMLAAMQLDVFTPLKDGPLTAVKLAEALEPKVQAEKLSQLLYLLVKAGLLEVEEERFSNTEEADKFLVSGRPEYIGGLGGFFNALLDIALKTAESLRTGEPKAKHDFSALPDEELQAYFQRQIHSSLAAGREIAAKIDFSKFENLLDAGGGSGGVSMAVCGQYPRMKAAVADFPRVVKLAEGFIAEAGLSGRIDVAAVDLCSEPPSGPYQAAILRALIQTLSRQEARACLGHIGRAMAPGGRIFIIGNVLDNSRLGPPAARAFDLVFLNSYDHGRAYTAEEYGEMLAEAGFGEVEVEYEALADGSGLISAVKKR